MDRQKHAKATHLLSIGGIDCPCCRPPQTTKRDAKRMINRANRRAAKREVQASLGEHQARAR